MLQMGDEVRRSQQGNNNAYCQDNEISWMDWGDIRTNAEVMHFTQGIIAFTQDLAIFRQERFWVAGHEDVPPHVVWHGVRLGEPDWTEHSHSLALELHAPEDGEHLYAVLNAYWEPLTFELPSLSEGHTWHRIVDTNLPPPDDYTVRPHALMVKGGTYTVSARSSLILMAW